MAVEIVGVVGDIRNVPLGQTIEPAVYVPTHQFPFSDLQIAVKAASAPAAVAAIRNALRTAAPEVPMGTARTWGHRFGDRTAEPRLLMAVLAVFGVSAGLLAALGVYGLLAWSVSTRSRELAIRLALGAKPRAVGASVVRQAALLVGTGLVIGVAGVRALTQVLAAVLYQVSAMDTRAITAAAALLALSALLACLPAALRAMRVDPADGLRSE
jgi:putative ABC transport system permease protein